MKEHLQYLNNITDSLSAYGNSRTGVFFFLFYTTWSKS